MILNPPLPRVIIIDDLFGRAHTDNRNEERANLCAQYLLKDVTDDEVARTNHQRIKNPVAEAVFHRGQRPRCARVGDVVENDLPDTLDAVADGWNIVDDSRPSWAVALLDLCFYTGKVTLDSDRKIRGMPEGVEADEKPEQYFGLTILRHITEQFPDLPVVIFSSKPRESANLELSLRGALGFLDRSSIEAPEVFREYLWRHGLIADTESHIIGRSKNLLKALRSARRAAKDRRHVLLRGSRGTGKELFARFIHQNSNKPESPLAIIDSGTLSPHLYGSELFGHKRGAFTGADRDRHGRIAEARDGDVFLDEIGNMPFEVQLGLLRVIEYRVVTPIGGSTSLPVDVRFISATNDDIESKAIAENGFRSDLLDRLREGGTIALPDLADRKSDIPALVLHFVRQAEAAISGAMHRQIHPTAYEKAMDYDWPGNLRELRNCLYAAVSNHRDVEYLVADHMEVPSARLIDRVPLPRSAAGFQPRNSPTRPELERLLNDLGTFDFEAMKRDELEGILPDLQRAMEAVLVKYLRAILTATTKPVEGKVQIHPAIKMAMGDANVSASKAAGIVKSLLKRFEAIDDPVLKQAYETAVRLRPNQSKAVQPGASTVRKVTQGSGQSSPPTESRK